MEPLLAEIKLFAGTFAPRGWAFCDGSILSIAQFTALFSLLGTSYGGDGRTTFALPDLRGRVPVRPGRGPGDAHSLGERGGTEAVTLIPPQMPQHTHAVNASGDPGHSEAPTGAVWAAGSGASPSAHVSNYGAAANVTMSTGALALAGGSQPHPNMQPYTCTNYIIAVEGIYPSRP